MLANTHIQLEKHPKMKEREQEKREQETTERQTKIEKN